MTWLLALVTACNTSGKDAIQELTAHSSQTEFVVDGVNDLDDDNDGPF